MLTYTIPGSVWRWKLENTILIFLYCTVFQTLPSWHRSLRSRTDQRPWGRVSLRCPRNDRQHSQRRGDSRGGMMPLDEYWLHDVAYHLQCCALASPCLRKSEVQSLTVLSNCAFSLSAVGRKFYPCRPCSRAAMIVNNQVSQASSSGLTWQLQNLDANAALMHKVSFHPVLMFWPQDLPPDLRASSSWHPNSW